MTVLLDAALGYAARGIPGLPGPLAPPHPEQGRPGLLVLPRAGL